MHSPCLIKYLRNMLLLKSNFQRVVMHTQISGHVFSALCSTMSPSPSPELRELCTAVCGVGSLDDLEACLDRFKVSLTSSLVSQIIDSCKCEAPTRRMLRFFLWSCRNLDSRLKDQDFNHVIRVFADKRDSMAMDILLSDFSREGRVMDSQTFSIVAEMLVKLGKEDQALGIFKNLEKFKCSYDRATVIAIVNALCMKGHARRAEGVVWHHKDKILGSEAIIYKSLLYGWSAQKNVKEARRILKEMKSNGVMPDLSSYNLFLRCLCQRNLKSNPSGLVPEALNVMMEMRANEIAPNSTSYNILLSCLGRTRRVKESCQILTLMKKSECSPDWFSYYLVARVLFLSGRFGKGRQIVEEMVAEGLTPEPKFYYDLIGVLIGVERVNYALELFEQMKKLSLGPCGPVYDLVIPKLCRAGDFKKGTELWDEATRMGVMLGCSSDVLDPSVTEVFRPARKAEEVGPAESSLTKTQGQGVKGIGKERKACQKMNNAKKKLKMKMKRKRKKKNKNAA